MNPLQQIADNLSAAGLDHPAVDDAVIKLTNMAAHPSRGVVDDGMVERACAAFMEASPRVKAIAHDSMRAALQAAALPAVPDSFATHGDSALAHLSNALDDLDSSPDQRPVPLIKEAMYHVRAMLAATPAHDQPEGSGNG